MFCVGRFMAHLTSKIALCPSKALKSTHWIAQTVYFCSIYFCPARRQCFQSCECSPISPQVTPLLKRPTIGFSIALPTVRVVIFMRLTHCLLMPFETHRQITVEANVAGGYIDTGNINVSINLAWMLYDQLCKS